MSPAKSAVRIQHVGEEVWMINGAVEGKAQRRTNEYVLVRNRQARIVKARLVKSSFRVSSNARLRKLNFKRPWLLVTRHIQGLSKRLISQHQNDKQHNLSFQRPFTLLSIHFPPPGL